MYLCIVNGDRWKKYCAFERFIAAGRRRGRDQFTLRVESISPESFRILISTREEPHKKFPLFAVTGESGQSVDKVLK